MIYMLTTVLRLMILFNNCDYHFRIWAFVLKPQDSVCSNFLRSEDGLKRYWMNNLQWMQFPLEEAEAVHYFKNGNKLI